eukprot:6975167-Pyramimonas_sp.AAC.1
MLLRVVLPASRAARVSVSHQEGRGLTTQVCSRSSKVSTCMHASRKLSPGLIAAICTLEARCEF